MATSSAAAATKPSSAFTDNYTKEETSQLKNNKKEEEDEDIPYDKWNWLSSSHTTTSSSPNNNNNISRYERSLQHLTTAPKKWRLISPSTHPEGRCSHTLTSINDHTLLLFGGGYSASFTNPSSSDDDDNDDGDTNNNEEVMLDNSQFVHLEDMWTLDAFTAKWSKIEYIVEREEEEEDGWGMKFGPARRGHAAAYYHGYVSTDDDDDEGGKKKASSSEKVKEEKKGILIIFGGITEAPAPPTSSSSPISTTKKSSNPLYLGDTWIFHLPTKKWRRLPTSSPDSKAPSPRRGAVSWIDGDYFYVFGGEDARGTSAAFADAIHGVDLVFEDDHHQNHQEEEDVEYYSNSESDNNETTTTQSPQQQQQQQQQHCPILYRLGPLSSPQIKNWKWTIQKSFNSSFLHKRAPNWPTISTRAKPFGSVAFAASAIVGRKLWIFGGLEWHLGGPESQLFYRLDLDTFDWVVLHAPKNAPCPRYNHGMTSIGRYLIIGGGVGLLRPHDVVVDVADDGTAPPVVQMEGGGGGGVDIEGDEEDGNDEEFPFDESGHQSLENAILLQRLGNVDDSDDGDNNDYDGEDEEDSDEMISGNVSNGVSSSGNSSGISVNRREEDVDSSDVNDEGNARDDIGRNRIESLVDENTTGTNQTRPNLDFDAAAPMIQPQQQQYHHQNWTPTFAIQERTIFDLHLFDTETMKWSTVNKNDVKGPWPSARNAFSLTRLGRDRAIVFGGGVYPSSYYDDTFVLEFDLPNKIPKPTGSMEDDICRDMSKLLSTGLMSDMTLIAGGTEDSRVIKEFPVHKVILAMRCNFFHIMFSGPYAESSASEIHLPDVDPDALEIVLKYIYTGSIDCQSLLGSDDDDVMFFRGCAVEGSDINSSLGLISSVLRLCDMWELTRLFETIEDLLALSAKRWDSSSLSCYADTIGLIVFGKAHSCKRLVMQGLEFARRRWDKMKSSPVVKDADPEIVAEIEAFVHSLL